MIAGLVFMFIIFTVLLGFMNGTGGMNSTVLVANVLPTDNVITVQSTAGFLSADQIIIDGETLTYTSMDYTHFYVPTRVNGLAHYVVNANGSPTMVYNQQTSLINNALGFNVNAVTTSSGVISIFTIPAKFFTITMPNLISGNSILKLLPGAFAWLGYIWLGLTAGMVISLGVAVIWVLSGIVGKITP
jgi:hypothetical protein